MKKQTRAQLVAAGRCPHCGKPCAPFYECQSRRDYKRLKRGGKAVSRAPQPRVIGVRNPADHHVLARERPARLFDEAGRPRFRFVAGRAMHRSD